MRKTTFKHLWDKKLADGEPHWWWCLKCEKYLGTLEDEMQEILLKGYNKEGGLEEFMRNDIGFSAEEIEKFRPCTVSNKEYKLKALLK